MINLFNINNYTIDTSLYNNYLHGSIVTDLENSICSYVGAKYGVALNSATSAIFLTLLDKQVNISIPSIIPPVVLNAIYTSDNKYTFIDDINWVGDSYALHNFKDYKIVDSAQKIEPLQFKNECNDNDLMIFSFYPTKPIGSCDGGLIVSNDSNKIEYLREMSLNGMTFSSNNWDRKNKYIGYKMYMNSIQADIAYKNFMNYPIKREKLLWIRDIYNKKLNLNNKSLHLYRIRIKNNIKFLDYMKSKNIMCGIHYRALHLDSVYNKEKIYLPLSELESQTTASIPFHENLTTEDINYIIESIYEYNTK